MKQIFEITVTETSTKTVYIEAESVQDATIFANENENIHFRENQDYSCNISHVGIVHKNAVKGKYVESAITGKAFLID